MFTKSFVKKAAKSLARTIVSFSILLFARAITTVRGIFAGIEPDGSQRIYFANHASHGDFVLVWTVLPPWVRKKTRPVAAAEYWTSSALRRFIGKDVFNAVLIERDPATRTLDPIAQMAQALDNSASLILFPEGTRNMTDAPLLSFKSGLFHLAKAKPEIDMVPVWIDNLNRVMPKGGIVPIPLICTVTFGAPIRLQENEEKDAFLDRARTDLLTLAPKKETTAP